MKSYFCQDEYGQIAPVYSISAGLDYPGIGPEHAQLHDSGRAQYVPVTDDEAVDSFIEKVGAAYKDKIGYAADFYVVEIGDGPVKLD